ncbi:BatD family protein [Paraburkholderia sediminicola]|uniref:BatD family protein n=1 Tax=Paraburkholderia sediminicola TaxID=458836 RepID=UPI0038BA91E3
MTAVFLRVLLVIVWLGAVCVPAPALADPAPRTMVRAHLEPAGPVVAGSEVKLVVDLLTTTWFTEAPNWPLFTVADAIVSLPDEQANNLSEDIDGVRWFGVSRAYRIAPQAGKTYDIPPFAITVCPGGMNTPVQVMTPALKLVTTLPPGAQDMSVFFPTTKLTATQTIEPSKQQLRVGDSITRTITQSAAGTESMMIPPVSLGEVDGLKRYAKPSTTRNIVQDRVGLVAGERTDSVTYIADHNGRFKLPPVTIEWWNTKTQTKETIELPGVTFSASTAREKPLFDIPADMMSQGLPHRIIVIHSGQLIAGCVIVLGLLVVVWARGRIAVFLRRTKHRIGDARQRWLESEAVAWRRLCTVARKGEWPRTIPALYRWMDRSGDFGHPARLENFPCADDPKVAELADAVTVHFAEGVARDFRWADAETALRRASKKRRLQQHERAPLPPLNEM